MLLKTFLRHHASPTPWRFILPGKRYTRLIFEIEFCRTPLIGSLSDGQKSAEMFRLLTQRVAERCFYIFSSRFFISVRASLPLTHRRNKQVWILRCAISLITPSSCRSNLPLLTKNNFSIHTYSKLYSLSSLTGFARAHWKFFREIQTTFVVSVESLSFFTSLQLQHDIIFFLMTSRSEVIIKKKFGCHHADYICIL